MHKGAPPCATLGSSVGTLPVTQKQSHHCTLCANILWSYIKLHIREHGGEEEPRVLISNTCPGAPWGQPFLGGPDPRLNLIEANQPRL
jgi:hypothetical protein